MTFHVNHLGQPIGPPLPEWTPRARPGRIVLGGRSCRVEPLRSEQHAGDLYAANAADKDGRGWTYLSIGPFDTEAAYRAWVGSVECSTEPLYFAIINAQSGKALGSAALMRIAPEDGSIEVGMIRYAPALQRSIAGTEAMFLLMRYAFEDLRYRRYEWKCDALNEPSRAAALRLGFAYEGTFRNATVYKGRSRDTAWFSIIDSEWPAVKQALQAWLDPGNFDSEGRQRARLSQLMASARGR